MATQNSLNNSSNSLDVTSGLINTTGTVTINSGTSTMSLSTDASATTVNIATGSAVKTVTLGSTNSSSSLALQFGTADFTLASATGTVMSASDTGEITYPLQPAFLAQLATDDLNVTGNGATYTLGTPTALTEVFDQNNDFATGTFTAPVTGRYWLAAELRMIDLTALMTQGIFTLVTSNRSYKGGYNSPGAIKNAASQVTYSVESLCDMDTGDTAQATMVISNGAGDTADSDGTTPGLVTIFNGVLIC